MGRKASRKRGVRGFYNPETGDIGIEFDEEVVQEIIDDGVKKLTGGRKEKVVDAEYVDTKAQGVRKTIKSSNASGPEPPVGNDDE